nr:orotidine-5'-phosphate decarboxylase [bacterium]
VTIGDQVYAPFGGDCLTVNGYLGTDGISPLLKHCAQFDKGIFVLVKTSNPSSGELQDKELEGAPLYEQVGRMVSDWGKGTMGQHGYAAVGAVVGATWPKQGAVLRRMLPGVFFLVPGYGAQGATAQDLAGCFDEKGGGAIVNASRSLLTAWKKAGTEDFAAAAKQEALAMRQALRAAVGQGKQVG